MFKRLQNQLHWWEKNASHYVINLIENGVQADLPLPKNLSLQVQKKSDQEVALATDILLEYQKVGAVEKVQNVNNTRHLVPWFVLTKQEEKGVKHRLISDCRELNQFCVPQKFTLEHMAQIYPVLKQNWWAVKLDLKDAYFHLELGQKTERIRQIAGGTHPGSEGQPVSV